MENHTNLSLKNVSKHYGEFSLRNISLELPEGSILGLVGSNGAGKTTTMRLILGLAAPDSGTIQILGTDASRLSPTGRGQIGVVFDENSFPEGRTPHQMGRILQGIYPSWDAAFYQSCLQRMGLPPRRKIQDYSRGMKMKLAIAAALAHRPRLLLLDEPTSGLDPVMRGEILDLFLEFIQDEENSILLSSHITTDLARIADYIAFMHDGQILLQGEKDAILESWGILLGPAAEAPQGDSSLIGLQIEPHSFRALVPDRREAARRYPTFALDSPTLDDILFHLTRGDQQ